MTRSRVAAGAPAGGLRIGLVCPYALDTPGGVQNHVIGLAGYLAGRGHDVAVLAPGVRSPDPVRRSGPDLDGASAGTPGMDRFTSAGRAVGLPYNGSVARVNFGPLTAARVRRWLRVGRFDLVHLHEPITPSISMLSLWATDQPVVATFHTANPRSRTMWLAGRVLQSSIDKIDERIAVSQTARQMVRRHLGRDTRVIPNGFDFADFGSAPLLTRPQGRPRLVFLGRLAEARKGLDVLLAALPAIQACYPDVEVLVAGHGERSLGPPYRLLGRVSDGERARLLTGADVFIAPQLARESFGLVLIEAMAAGAPVVASDLAAFVDVIRPDVGRAAGDTRPAARSGRLFPAGDPAALAGQVLATLASRPPEQLAQRIVARELTRRYDWSVVGPAIEDVYADALGTRRPVADEGVESERVRSGQPRAVQMR